MSTAYSLILLADAAADARAALAALAHQTWLPEEVLLVDRQGALRNVLRASAPQACAWQLLQGGDAFMRALRLGQNKGRGHWLLLQDARDSVDPQRAQTLLSAAESLGARIAYSWAAPRAALTRPPARLARSLLLAQRLGSWPAASFALLHGNPAVVSSNLVIEASLLGALSPLPGLLVHYGLDLLLGASVHEESLCVQQTLYRVDLGAARLRELESEAALAEREACLVRYLRSAARAPLPNPQAPQSWTWPGLFEFHLEQAGVAALWQRHILGYVPQGRTVRAPH